MPKTDPTSSVVLYEEAKLTAAARLTKFQAKTVDAIETVARTEQDNVVRRIGVGIALRIIKHSLPHGQFQTWLKKNVKDAGYTQCTYMMRVADVFLAKASLGKSDLLAIANGKTALAPAKGKAKGKVQQAAASFVGELAWGELLAAHGIKGGSESGGSSGASAPAGEPSAEELYQQSRDEIGTVLTQAETLFLKENRLQHLAGHPEEVAGVVTALRALADKVEQASAPLLKK